MTTTKHEEIDYRLLIKKVFDETLQKEGVLFYLETTKQFTNFAYIIDIQDTRIDDAIAWSLHGLKSPSMIMPTTGTAQFSKVYFDLPKKFTFTFLKKTSIKTAIEVKYLKTSYSVSGKQSNFLKVYTDEDAFERNRLSDALPPETKPDIHRKSSVSQSKSSR